jgi:hypothetical protein
MLILLDSGSSHSFVSSNFVKVVGLSPVPMPSRRVKLANGEWITTNQKIYDLHWYCQGHILSSEMIVLDMHPYDAILGYDWLQQHSPMNCDWHLATQDTGIPRERQNNQAARPSSAANGAHFHFYN